MSNNKYALIRERLISVNILKMVNLYCSKLILKAGAVQWEGIYNTTG